MPPAARAQPALRVLCWDHPRCVAPLAAAAREWTRRHPDVTFAREARPLAAFNDQPLAEAVAGYDLVFVDHPVIAEAEATGCLTPLDGLVPPAVLARLAADAVAGSHATYRAGGRQWALAVDAACQVAVSDPARTGAAPTTWDAVLELARGGGVGLPLYPSDAVISLLSIAAGEAGGALPEALFTESAVAMLAELVSYADVRCFALNPPRMLDLMAAGDGSAYVPLLFGYSDYQRPGAPGRRLRFHDAPTAHGRPGGTVLGGVGLAVPATSGRAREAADFAAWFAGAEAQRDLVCPHGGQPASATVWADPAADALAGGFFSATRATLRAACVRPATRWWPRFQEAAGVQLTALLRAGAPPARIHRTLARLLDEHRAKEARA